jgi:hypothetical protein
MNTLVAGGKCASDRKAEEIASRKLQRLLSKSSKKHGGKTGGGQKAGGSSSHLRCLKKLLAFGSQHEVQPGEDSQNQSCWSWTLSLIPNLTPGWTEEC